MAVYKLSPTKANLIKVKNSLEFAKKGYDLLDKKRTVLIKEMMSHIEEAKALQSKINESFKEGYHALSLAELSVGADKLEQISHGLATEEGFEKDIKVVMGVELPVIKPKERELRNTFGFFQTDRTFDECVTRMIQLKELIYNLAELENSVYRLALEIQKTVKRANALEKLQIPRFKASIKEISSALEEKEREEFFRLKKLKAKKARRYD